MSVTEQNIEDKSWKSIMFIRRNLDCRRTKKSISEIGFTLIDTFSVNAKASLQSEPNVQKQI